MIMLAWVATARNGCHTDGRIASNSGGTTVFGLPGWRQLWGRAIG